MFHSDTYGKLGLTQIPDKITDYFNKMKFEQTYQNCYKNTDWKLMKFGIFDLNWGQLFQISFAYYRLIFID